MPRRGAATGLRGPGWRMLDCRPMDIAPLVNALLLGVVEGLTEFLPVSSTGHLIIVSDLLGVNDEKGKVFDIVIQLGAILAVCWEYRVRFARAFSGIATDAVQQRFAANLAVAFLPAALLGLAFQREIKAWLFNPVSVAAALVLGALAIFAIERWYARHGAPRINSVDEMRWPDALKVGFAQCLSSRAPRGRGRRSWAAWCSAFPGRPPPSSRSSSPCRSCSRRRATRS